jgi:hypothetical protein
MIFLHSWFTGQSAPALNLVFSLHCANRSYDFAAFSQGSFLAWVLGLQVSPLWLQGNFADN